MIDPTYWFMLPVGIIVSAIAMTAGIGGAILFSPIFFLGLKLRPDLALATGIFIEIFGFGSGVISYAKEKLINYKIGKHILIAAVPSAIVGVILSKFIPPTFLQVAFAGVLLVLAASMFHKDKEIIVKAKQVHGVPRTAKHKKHKHDSVLYGLSTLGGLFLGLVSSGLGELNEYYFLKRKKMHVAQAAGTSVFTVIITALVASIAHASFFVHALTPSMLSTIFSIVLFTAPGVIIGAQIGVKIAEHLAGDTMKYFLGILFAVIATLSLSSLL